MGPVITAAGGWGDHMHTVFLTAASAWNEPTALILRSVLVILQGTGGTCRSIFCERVRR